MVIATRKIGRDARPKRTIPVREAERRKSTAVVETIRVPKPAPKAKGKGSRVAPYGAAALWLRRDCQ
jgi:hypothetical protein